MSGSTAAASTRGGGYSSNAMSIASTKVEVGGNARSGFAKIPKPVAMVRLTFDYNKNWEGLLLTMLIVDSFTPHPAKDR